MAWSKLDIKTIIDVNKDKVVIIHIEGEDVSGKPNKLEVCADSNIPVVQKWNNSNFIEMSYCVKLDLKSNYLECVLEGGKYFKVKTGSQIEYKLEKSYGKRTYYIPYSRIIYIQVL